MRKKNTRPTQIYWLVDTRTGLPFYCGKTVGLLERRLIGHCSRAKTHPNRLVSKRILECGEHIRIQLIETVPANIDWVERERKWIGVLRANFTDTANTSDGGEGTPGVIHTIETRRRLSESHKGVKLTPEAIAKRTAKVLGSKRSSETRAKQSESAKARWERPEYRENFSRGRAGFSQSPEARAKISAAQIGKKQHPNQAAGLKKANTGRPKTAEERAKIGAAQRGKIVSQATRQKLREAALRQHAQATHV